MPAEKNPPQEKNDLTNAPRSRPAEATSGTETEQKGGSDTAKRQAERDWQNSPKESGD